TQCSTASARPSVKSASDAIGPWLARPPENSGPVGAKRSRASSSASSARPVAPGAGDGAAGAGKALAVKATPARRKSRRDFGCMLLAPCRRNLERGGELAQLRLHAGHVPRSHAKERLLSGSHPLELGIRVLVDEHRPHDGPDGDVSFEDGNLQEGLDG